MTILAVVTVLQATLADVPRAAAVGLGVGTVLLLCSFAYIALGTGPVFLEADAPEPIEPQVTGGSQTGVCRVTTLVPELVTPTERAALRDAQETSTDRLLAGLHADDPTDGLFYYRTLLKENQFTAAQTVP